MLSGIKAKGFRLSRFTPFNAAIAVIAPNKSLLKNFV